MPRWATINAPPPMRPLFGIWHDVYWSHECAFTAPPCPCYLKRNGRDHPFGLFVYDKSDQDFSHSTSTGIEIWRWVLKEPARARIRLLYCARIRVAAHGGFLGVRGGGMRYRYEDSAVLVRYSCRCSAGICKIPRSTGLLEFDRVQAGSVTK